MNFGEAFGVSNTYAPTPAQAYGIRHLGLQPEATDSTTAFQSRPAAQGGNYDDDIRLAPYTYGDQNHSFGSQDFPPR